MLLWKGLSLVHVSFLALTSSLSRLITYIIRWCGINRLLWKYDSFTNVISLDHNRLYLEFNTSLRMTRMRSPFDQRSGSELYTHLSFSVPQLLLNILATDFMTCKIMSHLFPCLLILVKVMDHTTCCASSIIQRIVFSSFIPDRWLSNITMSFSILLALYNADHRLWCISIAPSGWIRLFFYYSVTSCWHQHWIRKGGLVD